EADVTSERTSQIQWQKHLVRSFFQQKHPDSVLTDINETQIKLRMYKSSKQNMLTKLTELKRQRIIDRNNRQVVALENYLLSETQTILLSFDSTIEQDIEQSLLVSATHPFVIMALHEKDSHTNTMFTSCKIKESNILQKGQYLFACYKWKECGYRRSSNIRVLLFDPHSNRPLTLSLADFEHLLLTAKPAHQTTAPDLSPLDAHIYQYQQEAKEHLTQTNENIINKKLSTLNRYYSKQIEKAQYNLHQSQNERIQRMHQARIQKLKLTWQEKQEALNNQRQADILVELFAFGTIEVKS
ncbi:MAG: hypothetical protein IIV08_06100, partial [Selenomonadales bacterium]|nr:hypothetical protein [Selenomonadales bacterium]